MDGRCPSNGGLTADESQLLYAVSAMHGQHGPEAQREAHASLMVFQASVEAWGVFLRLLRIVSASADSASTSTGTSDSTSAGTFASASPAVASASASAGPQGHSEAERFYVLQALGDKVARQWAQCPGECRVPLLESATHLVQLVVGGATDLSPLLVRRLCLLFAGLALRASPEEWPDPFGDMHSLLLAGGGGGERGERSMAGSPVHTRAEFVVLELFALLPEELERVGGAAATALLRIRPSVMGMLDTLMRTAVGAGAEDPAMSTMTLSKSLRCLESWVACSVSADCDDGGRGGGGGGDDAGATRSGAVHRLVQPRPRTQAYRQLPTTDHASCNILSSSSCCSTAVHHVVLRYVHHHFFLFDLLAFVVDRSMERRDVDTSKRG